MSMNQQFMACVLALSLIAMLGATAAKELTQMKPRERIWLDPNAPAALLGARLNITTVAKTQPAGQ
jgi:hypothetical protein